MPLTPVQRQTLRKGTRDAAGAFVEDMEYLREVAKRKDTSKREVRHISGTLRKMIVDRDIAKMRFAKQGRIFDIVTVHDPDDSGRYLVCRAREAGL